MILQSLVQLYDRLAADPATSATIAKQGFAPKPVTFEIVLRTDGKAVINDLRVANPKNGKPIPRDIIVPTFPGKRTSGVKSGFLCDKTSYLFGCPDPGDLPDDCRSADEFAAFRDLHLGAQPAINHSAFDRVCAFLSALNPTLVTSHPLWMEFAGKNGVFRIEGEQRFVHEIPAVADYWAAHASSSAGNRGICLATGVDGPIAEVHPPIKGVIDPGGQAEKGIVGFNKDAFISYGKKQSLNAPVSELAAFKYATALNWLLKHQYLRIGDTTVVFWSEQHTEAESLLGYLLGDRPANDSSAQAAALNQKLETFLDALRQGGGRLAGLGDDVQTPFFILGLAPNAARISIRFWYASTLGELLQNLKRHHTDLEIQKEYADHDLDFPPIWMLLKETARTSDDIPPLLGGSLARAILTGGLYPQAFACAVLRRIRIDAADGGRRTHVTYLRAALLKAYLTRNCQQSITMSLDPENSDVPYRLGRLFAALEKTQRDALGDTNTTVRERFYAAASATPGPVFPRILRTYTHHLAKLDGGMKVVREQLVQEILDPIAGRFPAALGLEEQGRFALGYYHQMRAFFTKRGPAVQ